jgi:hypothetical protein
MSASTSSPSPARLLPARAISIVGLVAIALSLVDYLTLLISPEFGDRTWVQATTAQVVDRGIIPAIGMALLLFGLWMESRTTSTVSPWVKPLKGIVLVIATLFGIVLLITAPVHLLNVRSQAQENLAQIGREAVDVENQLDSEAFKNNVDQRQQVLRQQAEELLNNEEQFNALLESGDLSDEQKSFLRQAQSNPAALDEYIATQTTNFAGQLIGRIRERRAQLDSQERVRAIRSGIQTGANGFVLAFGYLAIGWFGFAGGNSTKTAPSRPRR